MTRVDMETAPGFHLAPGPAINLEQWEARLRAEAAFLRARRRAGPNAAGYRHFDKELRAMIAALPGQPRELVIGLAYYTGSIHMKNLWRLKLS